jgi:SagB-type dehydrogenase family enzyme
VDRHLVALLTFCGEPRDLRDAVRFLAMRTERDEDAAEAAILALLETGVLLADDAHRDIPSRVALQQWRRSGWGEAFHFHIRTNLLPKTDYSAESAYRDDIAAMRRKAAVEPLPDNYKDYDGALSIPLTADRFQGIDNPPSLESILAEDPQHTRSRVLDLMEFGWFVHRAYGQTAIRRLPVSGQHVGKTSPSGGSRHPTEVYPVVLDVAGIEPGLYHYSVRHHALETLRTGDFLDALRTHVFLSPNRPPFEPRVVFILTTIFERSMFRYREPRSYRVMHFDLGHLMQTSAYLASSVRRSSYRAYAMHDREVDRLIGIDGITEASMAFVALG